jgi:GAF domain-containing protein
MVKEASDEEVSEQSPRVEELERTLESLREDSEIAHMLLGLSGALAELRTVEETLWKAVRVVRELFKADRCYAAALDEAGRSLEIRAQAGLEHAASDALEQLGGRGRDRLPLMAEAASTMGPVLVPDVVADGRIPAEEAAARRLQAYICIPLVRWGQDFGALVVEFEQPQLFTSKESALARGVARQVGVALANARRFNLLASLRSVGLSVGSQLSVGAVSKEVARGATKLLSGDAAALYFIDSGANTLIASGSHGLAPDAFQAIATIDLGRAPWSELHGGSTVTVRDLRAVLGSDRAPASAAAALIPGAGSAVLGAIVVFGHRPFSLGIDEAEALHVLATQSATAIANAQRFERQRRVARSLQAALLRTDMPVMEGCLMHATYEPASSESDIGGDYFDAFDLPDGRIGMVVGDVSGKGAEAAAYTAMAKYMLRAFAIRNAGPSSVLFHLNNALVQGLDEDKFTTLMYAVIDPESNRCKLALGGHPAPLVYRADAQEVEVLEAEGAIVGAFRNERFEQLEFDLAPGDVLLAYTDGLIEARTAEGDMYGREGVAASLLRNAHLRGKDLTTKIYEDARSFGTVWDDTVVFALSCVQAHS